MKNKKKIIITTLTVLGIILTTVGVTYAFFSYSRNGLKIHSITSGNITFKYTEDSQGLSLNDVVPMTDNQGKSQSNAFDFTITSKTSETIDIPYYITTVRSGTGTNMDGIVKVYLTKVDENNNETEVLLSSVSELGTYTHTSINTTQDKLLHTDRVYAGTTSYKQKYRLRMWISDDAEFIVQNNGVDTYPYEGKTYTLKVNVYGNGESVNQSQVEFRENVDIDDIEIGSNVVTSDTNTLNDTEIMPVGQETMQKTITINTTNPNSIVEIENLTPTSMNSKTKKLSVTKTLDLILGTNTFKITISSVTGKTDKEYTLIIVTEYPSYNVNLAGSHITFGKSSLSIQYNNSKTVTVTPETGYYLSNAVCSNGYTINATTGTSATSQQTVTITNPGVDDGSECLFTTAPRTYSINYNLNGGIQGSNPVTSYTKETNTFSLPTPTKDYYTFGGWYTSSSLTGSSVSQIAKGTTGNKTYYAKWTPDTYSIAYHLDGGSNPSGAKTSYNVETATFSLPSPTKADNNFDGWYDNSSLTGNPITEITVGSHGNKEYWAKWSAVIYTSSADIVSHISTTSTKKVIACDILGENQYNNCNIYSTLQNAFDSRTNGYVVMTANLTTTTDTTLATGKTFILDLYGKTLTSSSLGIKNSGTLTVNNSTQIVGGIISSAAAIRNESEGASLTINNGNISSSGTNSAAVINIKYGTLKIYGGTFTRTGNGVVISGNSVGSNAKIYIYDGTFNVPSGSSADVVGAYTSLSLVHIYGGIFTNNGTGRVIVNNASTYLWIYSGSFTAANNHVVANLSNGTIEFEIYNNRSATLLATSTDANANYNVLYNSGTGRILAYTEEDGSKLYLKSVAGVTVLNNGTGDSNNDYIGIQIGGNYANNCTATPSDTTSGTCVYNGSVEALKNDTAGKIRITGGTYIADNSYAVNNASTGTIDIKCYGNTVNFKGYFKSANNASINNNAGGTINIEASRANNCTNTMSDTTSGLCSIGGPPLRNYSSGTITANGGTYNNTVNGGAAANNLATGKTYLKNATFIGGNGVVRNAASGKGELYICSSTINATTDHFMNGYSGDKIEYYNITFQGVSTSRVDGTNKGTITLKSSCPW